MKPQTGKLRLIDKQKYTNSNYDNMDIVSEYIGDDFCITIGYLEGGAGAYIDKESVGNGQCIIRGPTEWECFEPVVEVATSLVDTTNYHKHHVEIFAYAMGKKIQYEGPNAEWITIDKPMFSLADRYRVAPDNLELIAQLSEELVLINEELNEVNTRKINIEIKIKELQDEQN